MLYMLGPLRIEVWPFNVDHVSESRGADYAVKAVVGAEQPLEFVGEGANEITLDGLVWPAERGGEGALGSIELLSQMRSSGKPQYLMRGDGKPFGWFAILGVSTRSDFLDRDGVGKRVGVSISLRRAAKPSAQTFFSLISRLVG
jgi:uncharacterized protein